MREFNIDLLRAISILIVVMSHYGIVNNNWVTGVHGVVLFFFVSGYCILLTAYKKKDFFAFWKARYIRLLPVFFICSAVVGVLKTYFAEAIPYRFTSTKDMVYSTLCIPTFDLPCLKTNYFFTDGAYWSLLVEFRYYLLFSILWYVFKLRKSTIFVLLACSLAALYTQKNPGYRNNDFFMYLVFFSFGMAYYEFTHKSKAIGIVGGLSSLYAFLFFSWYEVKHTSLFLNRENFLFYLNYFLVFLVIMKIFENNGNFRNRYLTYLAILSYPIYLLHQDLGYIIIKKLSDIYLDPIAGAGVAFLAMVALAALINESTERVPALVRQYFSNLRSAKPKTENSL